MRNVPEFVLFLKTALIATLAVGFTACSQRDCSDFGQCPTVLQEECDTSQVDTYAPESTPEVKFVDPCDGFVRADKCSTLHSVDGECMEAKPEPCQANFSRNALCVCVLTEKTCDGLEDNNKCTDDICNPVTGVATHNPVECDDNDDETTDWCNTADGACNHTKDCADGDICTLDSYDSVEGKCVNSPLCTTPGQICSEGKCVKHCEANADCSDGDLCTIDSCNADGACVNKYSLGDCDDHDASTTDLCTMQEGERKCVHESTQCTFGCDDGNKCTQDSCISGACVNSAVPCGNGTVCDKATGTCILDPGLCLGNDDCNDQNACTEDVCQNGACTHPEVECQTNEVCDAGTGECVAPEQHPECGSCDDGDKCTQDVCADNGVCVNAPQATDICGAGTELDPQDCKCKPVIIEPTCNDGDTSCEQFQHTGTLWYVVCADGKLWGIENCGAIETGVCTAGPNGSGGGCLSVPGN